MKKLPVQFRCYIELDREINQWVAVCIDLCLGAQADSKEEARQRIHEQIVDYFQDALEADSWDECAEMLSRKAPTSMILRYHTIRAKQKIAHFIGKHIEAARFKESVRGLTINAA